jgi:cystathionine beta-lyase/cystathionine gamma-synthase
MSLSLSAHSTSGVALAPDLAPRLAAAQRAEPCPKIDADPFLADALPASIAPALATLAIRAGREPDPTTGAILTPICQSTTYVQQAVGQHKGHTYSRASNPTVSVLEAALGALEGAPPSVCFSTGLSAITALFLSIARSGDEIIVSDVVYGGTVRLFAQILEPLGVTARYVDTSNPENVRSAINARTKLVFLETPANPTLKMCDLRAIAHVAREAGLPVAVDNTFLTPVLQRPLDLGCDISLYSTTKHIEGHNSTVGGAITTRDQALLDRLRLFRKTLGSIQAPFDAWLTLRGLKTLPLRIREHSRAALRVARWLEQLPKIARVHYPGLESHPQHALAKRQHLARDASGADAHGGVIAFELTGGTDAGVTLLNSVRLCSLAENLGAVETLITHPVTMTHGDVPRETRLRTGITDGLVRLSVGLEETDDIIADLAQALERAPA